MLHDAKQTFSVNIGSVCKVGENLKVFGDCEVQFDDGCENFCS